MSARGRWRGLAALAADGFEHGSRAIERVHLDTARRTFAILEAIPPIALPATVVRVVHDTTVAGVHAALRLTGRAARAALSSLAGPPDEP